MNNWDKIKKNPEKLKNMVNELGTRATGERFDVSKDTINDWLKKFGYHYNFDNQKWEGEEEKEEKGKFEKYLNEISTRNIDVTLEDNTYIIEKNEERVEVKKDRLEDLYYNYCELNLSQEETALNNDFIKDDFKLIKSAFDIIHDSLPLTDEEILNNTADENIQKILKNKKRKIKEKKPIEELRYLRNIAEKFYEKEYFIDKIIEGLDIKEIDYEAPKEPSEKYDNIMIITLADLHYGKKVLSEKVIGLEEDYNEKTLKKRMEKYIDRITKRLMIEKPEKVYIINLGDVVDNPISNTYPYQIYHQEITGEEQIMGCVDILAEFLLDIRYFCDDIKYIALPGNHTDERINSDILIGRILEKMFKKQDKIKFDVKNQMYKIEKIKNNNFVFTHGNNLREGKNTKENDILNIIHSLKLQDNNTYVMVGHKHHESGNEGAGFEYKRCPSIVGNDGYSTNELNRSSRPAQMFFFVENDGIVGRRKVYFD